MGDSNRNVPSLGMAFQTPQPGVQTAEVDRTDLERRIDMRIAQWAQNSLGTVMKNVVDNVVEASVKDVVRDLMKETAREETNWVLDQKVNPQLLYLQNATNSMQVELQELKAGQANVGALQGKIDTLREEMQQMRARIESGKTAGPREDLGGWDGLTLIVSNVPFSAVPEVQSQTIEDVKRYVCQEAGIELEAIASSGLEGTLKRKADGTMVHPIKIVFCSSGSAIKVLTKKSAIFRAKRWSVWEWLPRDLHVKRVQVWGVLRKLKEMDANKVWYDMRGLNVYKNDTFTLEEGGRVTTWGLWERVEDYDRLVERVRAHVTNEPGPMQTDGSA